MIFKALEIGSGDAFFIEEKEKQILFDSGGSKSKIRELLKKNTTINLAICSHNDSDHSNGFIGLLEDPKFAINEIWLPGLWIPILNFIIENRLNTDFLHTYFENKMEIERIKELGDETFNYESLIEESDISIENFDDKLQMISGKIDNNLSYSHFLNFRHSYWYNDELINLDRIIRIAGLAYQKGSLIRWFKPENIAPSIKFPNHNFRSLNAREVVRVDRVSKFNFLKLLNLTIENKYSLVFEYCKNNNPIILFSADSDFAFLKHVKKYKNNIIITAPHHGSASNSSVYSKINGDNIIWVRSDRKCKERPCSQFKKLNIKYCLTCTKFLQKKQIKFEYLNAKSQWSYLKGMFCNC